MLLRVLGGLLVLEAAFMLIPLLTAMIYGESDVEAFAISAAITGCAGLLLSRVLKVQSGNFGKRESFLLTGSVWVVFSLFGMLPFMISPIHMSVSDAFFEAMSGFTTTGATIRATGLPPLGHGLMMWQALIQWLGGMGIILFTLAVIPALNNSGGMQMFNAEVPGITHDKLMPRISQTAMSLWGIYTFLTGLLVLLLWIGPMDIFDSICHAFGTMSTGGFTTQPDGIAAYHSDYIAIVITIFMLLGGINFSLIFAAILGNWKKLTTNTILKYFMATILICWILFDVSILINGQAHRWQDLIISPLFQVVSTISSTGYIARDFVYWGQFPLALTFIMMFSGGCAGSTSGGAKIDRLIYLHRWLKNEISHCIHPNAIYTVKVNGKIANPDLVTKVVAFLALYMVLIAAGGTILSAMGCPTVDSFFSSFACISNTSFGASVTGYGDDFAVIPDAANWVLAALMMIGRLEIFTILVIFSPSFWR